MSHPYPGTQSEAMDALLKHLQGDEIAALRAFVLEVSRQDPGQPIGQRQSNKERAEDLCEQWWITA